ncbi:General transcription factor 3C polypeptide 6 [Chionoecetes opilio]|uniref:General transcription factor 3C polypeptide 6 n=1 Tax=Chionoecetes opilio TaxID=41210 RepID=A0A8J4YMM5_CHIOP|nr:General transcription factor 3C polypeptide 6 [Chionoecetes opilio]
MEVEVEGKEKEVAEKEKEVAEEEDEEEEETLVLVELHGVIDSEIFNQESFSKFKVMAIESDRPVLQVENFIFSGEYQHTLGTAALFEEEEKRLKCDPVFCKKPPRMLRYSCGTNKKLAMKRIFVSEKNAGQETGTHGDAGDAGDPGTSQGPSETPSLPQGSEVTEPQGQGEEGTPGDPPETMTQASD